MGKNDNVKTKRKEFQTASVVGLQRCTATISCATEALKCS